MNISFKGYRTYIMEGTPPEIGTKSKNKIPYVGADFYSNSGAKTGEVCHVGPALELQFDLALRSTPGVSIIHAASESAYPSAQNYFEAIKHSDIIDRSVGRREALDNIASVRRVVGS